MKQGLLQKLKPAFKTTEDRMLKPAYKTKGLRTRLNNAIRFNQKAAYNRRQESVEGAIQMALWLALSREHSRLTGGLEHNHPHEPLALEHG